MKKNYVFLLTALCFFALSGWTQKAAHKPFKTSPQKAGVAAPYTANIPFEVLFEEDFANFKKGTFENPDPTDIGGKADNNYLIKEGLFKQKGYYGFRVSEAGGAIHLQSYSVYPGTPYEEIRVGYFATPYVPMYGDIVVTFRARKHTQASNDTFISVLLADSSGPRGDWFKGELTNEWKEFRWETSEALFDDCTIQFAGNKGAVLVDDIKIERRKNKIAPPKIYPVENISETEFSLMWDEVADAKDYLYTLLYKDYPATILPSGKVEEGFDNIKANNGKIDTTAPNLPKGWTFNLAAQGEKEVTTASGTFVSGTQALVFDALNDEIISPKIEADMDRFTFWAKPSSTQMTTDPDYIQALIGVYVHHKTTDQWEHIANYGVYQLTAAGAVMKHEGDGLGEDIDQVKIKFVQRPDGHPITYYIDDITYEYSTHKVYIEKVKDQVVTKTSITQSGIDPSKEHYVDLRSRNGEIISTPTRVWIDGILGLSPSVEEATSITPTSFVANWKRNYNADFYRMHVYRHDKVKAAKEKVVLLHETFDKITEGTVQAPKTTQFYTPEWSTVLNKQSRTEFVVEHPVWAAGMIGMKSKPEWVENVNKIATPGIKLGKPRSLEVECKVQTTKDGVDSLYVYIFTTPLPKKESDIVGGVIIPLDSKAGAQTLSAVFDQEFLNDPEVDIDPTEKYYISFFNQSGVSFFLDEVKVIAEAAQAGDQFAAEEDLFLVPAENTSFEVKDRVTGALYSYITEVYRNKNFVPYLSKPSREVFADLSVSVEDIVDHANAVIRSVEGGIEIDAATPGMLQVFDLNGVRLVEVALQEGTRRVLLPQGMYIVRFQDQVTKALVK